MPRFIKFRTKAKGETPGSLIFIGQKKQEFVKIRVMSFDQKNLEEAECKSLEEAFEFLDPNRMTWINIDGLHDPEIIEKIGQRFDVAPLILEDIMNTDHRPKYEEQENLIYITTKLLSYTTDKRIESEQFSLVFGDHYVVTFQERVGTHFEPLRRRIRQTKMRLRSIHPDYMSYALLDCLVDQYMQIIGEVGSEIEDLEERIFQYSSKGIAEEIYRYRTELNFLRKTVRPVRDITSAVMRSELDLHREESLTYFSDLHDHVISVNEAIESYQTMIIDQYNMYNMNLSNKANDIMKTLTIFASIFIPLTFIAGIYGMNFDIIPELKWSLGYLYFWGLILIFGGGLFFYFRRKKWF
jgi:magnesium transporter